MPYVVGVTGQAGSGKSTAARYLSERYGVPVFDADACVRRLSETPSVQARLAALFPDAVRASGLDRAGLREIAFRDAEARGALEALFHPLVYAAAEKFIAEAESDDVLLDVPLLYRSGMDALCDKVIFVAAPKSVLLQRLTARPGVTEGIAEGMLASQEDMLRDAGKADAVVDGSLPLPAFEEALAAAMTP
jgi:dephospho-CoA kinase